MSSLNEIQKKLMDQNIYKDDAIVVQIFQVIQNYCQLNMDVKLIGSGNQQFSLSVFNQKNKLKTILNIMKICQKTYEQYSNEQKAACQVLVSLKDNSDLIIMQESEHSESKLLEIFNHLEFDLVDTQIDLEYQNFVKHINQGNKQIGSKEIKNLILTNDQLDIYLNKLNNYTNLFSLQLDFSYCLITDKKIITISQHLKQLKGIKELKINVSSNRILEFKLLLQTITQLDQLQVLSLNVGQNSLEKQSDYENISLSKLINLRSLTLILNQLRRLENQNILSIVNNLKDCKQLNHICLGLLEFNLSQNFNYLSNAIISLEQLTELSLHLGCTSLNPTMSSLLLENISKCVKLNKLNLYLQQNELNSSFSNQIKGILSNIQNLKDLTLQLLFNLLNYEDKILDQHQKSFNQNEKLNFQDTETCKSLLSCLIILYQQNIFISLINDFSDKLYIDQIRFTKLQNVAVVFQMNKSFQNVIMSVNLINQFLGKLLLSEVQVNKNHIFSIYNYEMASGSQYQQSLQQKLAKNPILESYWLQRNVTALQQLQDQEIQQLSNTGRVDPIWRPIMFENIQNANNYLQFNSMYIVHEYDGMLYLTNRIKDNSTFLSLADIQSNQSPYLDIRNSSYYQYAIQNYYSSVFSPEIFEYSGKPYVQSRFCQRRLKYPNSKSYAVLCIMVNLTQIESYFTNFNNKTKFSLLLDSKSLNIIYDSQKTQQLVSIQSIRNFEQQDLKDKQQFQQLINNFTQIFQIVLNSSDQIDLVGFDAQYQRNFEYNYQNITKYSFIQNLITVIDKIPSEELKYLGSLKKFQRINTFIVLNVISDDQKTQFTTNIKSKIMLYNITYFSLSLGRTILQPIVHLTKLIKEIYEQSKSSENQYLINQSQRNIQQNDTKNENDSFLENCLENFNIKIDEHLLDAFKEICSSSDSLTLLESFQNLFIVLKFTTQNILNENESTSLLNLNLQIELFHRFKNYRALGVCYNNIGVIHYNCARFQEALENFQSSIIYAKYELGFFSSNSTGDQYIKSIELGASILRKSMFQNSLQNSKQLKKQFLNIRKTSISNNTLLGKLIQNENNADNDQLYWNLFNRNLNFLKAFISFIVKNKQNGLLEIFSEVSLQNTSLSQIYLPYSNKRRMYNYCSIITGYFNQNQFDEAKTILDQLKHVYIKNIKIKTESINCKSDQPHNNSINTQSEHRDNLMYYKDKILLNPLKQRKSKVEKTAFFQSAELQDGRVLNNLFSLDSKNQYPSDQELKSNNILRYKSYSEQNKNIHFTWKLQNLDDYKIYVKQLTSQNSKNYQNNEQIKNFTFYQVRKQNDSQKITRYEFSSDIYFQYYSIYKAQYLVQHKDYYNAALILNNSLENCKYYLPHLKKQVIQSLHNIFLKNNIFSNEFEEFKDKYDSKIHSNFDAFIVVACKDQYFNKKAFGLINDLVNDLLYKQDDRFGVIQYCFVDKVYNQLIQATNIKAYKSNPRLFDIIYKNILVQNTRQILKPTIKSISVQYDRNTLNRTQSIFQTSKFCKQQAILENSQMNQSQKFSGIKIQNTPYKKSFQIQRVHSIDTSNFQHKQNRLNLENSKSISSQNYLLKSLYKTQQDNYNQKQINYQLSDFDQSQNAQKQNYLQLNPTLSPIFVQNDLLFDDQNSIYNELIEKKQICQNQENSTKIQNQQINHINATNLMNQNKINVKEDYIQELELIRKDQEQQNFTQLKSEECEDIYSENVDQELDEVFPLFSNQINRNVVSCQHKNEETKDEIDMKNLNPQNNFQSLSQKFKLLSKSLYQDDVLNNKVEQKSLYITNLCKQQQSKYFQKHLKIQNDYLNKQTMQKQNNELSFAENTELSFHLELCQLLINLDIELLVLIQNEVQSLEESSVHDNIFINSKIVISFFNSEEKLLQYIYNQREHMSTYAFMNSHTSFILLQDKKLSFNKLYQLPYYMLNPQFYIFDQVSTFYDGQEYKKLIQNHKSSHHNIRIIKEISSNDQIYLQQFSKDQFGFYEKDPSQNQMNHEATLNINNNDNQQSNQSIKFYKNQLALQICLLIFILSIYACAAVEIIKCKQLIDQENKIIRTTQVYLSLIYQIFNQILLIPLMQIICISSFDDFIDEAGLDVSNTQNDFLKNLYISAQVIGVINLILVFIVSWVFNFILNESTVVGNSGIIKNSSSLFVESLCLILKQTSTLIFSYSPKHQNFQTIQDIQFGVVIIYLLLLSINCIYKFTYSSLKIYIANVVFLAYSLLSVIVHLITVKTKILGSKSSNLILLITCLLVIRYCYSIPEQLIVKRMLDAFKKKGKKENTISNRIKFIQFFGAEYKNLLQSQEYKMMIISFLSYHKNNCKSFGCFCQHQEDVISFQKEEEQINDKFSISVVYNFFINFLVQEANEVIEQLKYNKNGKQQITVLKFIDLISQLGQEAKALQMIFEFLEVKQSRKTDKLNSYCKAYALTIKNNITFNYMKHLQDSLSSQQQDTKLYVLKVFKITEEKEKIKQKIKLLFQKKIILYEAVINNKLQQQKESYLIALYTITNQICYLESRIKNLWKEDNSQSTVRLFCFFLAEVKNDLYGAYIWSKSVFTEDPLEIRVNKQYNIDIKNDKVCRIYIDFGQNKAIINSFSQNASQILGIDQIKLQNVKQLSKLIPSPVADIHDSLIKEFFLTGKSKNFRQINMLQMKNLYNYSDPIQIFFDIDMAYTRDLRLVAFVKAVRNYSSVYLFFNSEGLLESASSNIFNKFYLNEDHEAKNFENSFWYNMSWSDMFPNIEMYKKTFESFENARKKTQEYKWIQQPIEISKQRQKNQDQIFLYSANVTIRQQVYSSLNQIQQYFYYVVEIENIRNQKNSEYTTKQAREQLKGNQQIGLYGLETMFSYTQDNFFSKDNLENIQEEEEGAEIHDSKMIKKNASLRETQELENMTIENAQNIFKQKTLHGINKLKLQRKMSDYRSNTEMSLSPEIKKDKSTQKQGSQLQLFDFSERGLQNRDSFMSPENKNKELRKIANRHNSYINSSRSVFMFDQNNQSSNSLTFFNDLRGLDDQSTNHYFPRQESSAKQLSKQIQVFSPSSYQNPSNNQINNYNSISQIYNNDDQQQSSRMNLQIHGDSFSITQDQNFYNLIRNYEQQQAQNQINMNQDLNDQLQTNRILKEEKNSESDQEEKEVENDFKKMKSFRKKIKTIQTSLVSQQQFEREYMKRINHNNTSSNVKGKYMYFNNYKSIHEFTQSKKLPNSLKILSATNLMQIILSVIQVIGLSFYIRESIFELQHKLNLIQLQSQFLSPIDEGFGALWKGFINMEDYFIGQLDGIPQSELDFFQNQFQLVRSNINYTYSRLQQFEYSIDNSQQDFINFLGEVSEFRENNGNYGYNSFNSTNRFIVVQMLKTFNFLKSYDWENNYLDNKGYYYDYSFLQMNMLKITNIFSQLSQNLIQVLQKISNQNLVSVNAYLVISSIILSILIITSFVYFIQFQAIKKSIFNLFHFNDAIWINSELQSTKEKLSQVNLDQNLDPFSDYHFNLYQYDEMLYIQEQTKEKMKSKFKSQKGVIQSNKIEIPIPQFYSRKLLVFSFILFLGVIIGNAVSISFIKKNFIDSYISNAQTFSYFQDSSNLASRLSGYRDLAIAISIHWFSYFNQNDTIIIRDEFDEKVTLLRSFITNQVIQINDLGPYKNQKFIKFLNAANSYDLCSQIMHLDGITLDVCNISCGGILKQGLSASLIKFINEIKSDRDQTQFKSQSKQKLELYEISLFCSRVLNYASDLLFQGIEDLCESSWHYLLTIILIFGENQELILFIEAIVVFASYLNDIV
ncbi:hypothetical protein ABPG74_020471 [Tetrahymena malaccensis]